MNSRSASTMIGRRTFLTVAGLMAAAPSLGAASLPQGRIEKVRLRRSDASSHERVRAWLPPDYGGDDRRYRTLYMLDGQFAFANDVAGQSFAADRQVVKLVAANLIQPTIIVAIDNLGPDRFRQYLPQAIYDQSEGTLRTALEGELQGRPLLSAQFLRFLTEELKPAIDRRYRTRAGRNDTAIFGASMAGPMAAAVFVQAQQAFGRAACVSPQWPLYDDRFIDHPQLLSLWPAFFSQLGAPAGRRLWLDHGTEAMDAGMAPHQMAIARQLVAIGWRPGDDLQTRVHRGAGHAFAHTAVQMDDILSWLLA